MMVALLHNSACAGFNVALEKSLTNTVPDPLTPKFTEPLPPQTSGCVTVAEPVRGAQKATLVEADVVQPEVASTAVAVKLYTPFTVGVTPDNVAPVVPEVIPEPADGVAVQEYE